ncbi:MAG: hypothetical protein H7Y86_20655 [Rhizobacter sp.]|nr:hypothetical protein [Ferruginibacter sp.]
MTTPILKTVSLFTLCLALILSPVAAQNIIGQKKVMPASLNRFVTKATVFSLNKQLTQNLHNNRQASIELSFEFENKTWILELEENNIFAKGFFVKDGNGHSVNYDKTHSLHYKGKVKGDPSSVAAVNIYTDEISAVIADKTGNINIGALLDNTVDMIIFREADLVTKPAFNCDAVAIPGNNNPLPDFNIPESITDVVNAEPVDIYFEADYSCYAGRGSNLANTISWVTDLANNVSVLYENDSVNVKLGAVKVWTVNDPYASSVNTSQALSAFSLAMTGGFPGDLAHLLSLRGLGGGRAYLDALCSNPQIRTGVSGNLNTSITPLPNYSWNSMVITHELGHNIASNHTQWCGWVGGAIDNCWPTEGGCPAGPAPVNGGTIMSYCHQNVGINLSNGFGPQPAALIRSRVRTSTCIFPKINFSRLSETVPEESADIDNNCIDYRLINVKIAASYAPVTSTDIQLLPTALSTGLQIGAGKDVEIMSPLNFTLNDTIPETIQLKVFDDAIIESTENLRLDFTIAANGSNALKGTLYNLSITNTDHRPDSTINQLAYYEPFDTMGNWTQDIIHGINSPNRWKVGNSGDPQFPNSAVYISSNDNTASYAGSSQDDSSVIRLISPAINTTGFINLKLNYAYKCRGEGVAGQGTGSTAADFGRLYYSANNGTIWSLVRDNIFNRNERLTDEVILPISANNNPNVRFAFEWINNSSGVNNPPMIIDSFIIVGTGAGPIQSEAHISNSDTAYVGPNQTVHFYNRVTGKAMASIKNLSSFDFGCMQVDLTRTGTNAVTAWGISNAEKITDKAFKITATNNSATAPYELSLYATNEEINGWTASSGNVLTEMNIIKAATDITQTPPATSPIYSNSNSNALFAANGDRIIKGIFSGFSWFALGKTGIALVCPGTSKQFTANGTGTSYQWQVNTGSGFVNINNGSIYSGAKSALLTLTNAPTSWYGYQYRCSITTVSGTEYSYVNELKFAATWKGSGSTAWELAANWECGTVPDANTDVYVMAGVPNLPQINNNTSIRTLTIMTGATVTASPGIQLNVMK